MAFSFENRSSILTLNLIIMIMLCTNHHHVLVNCDDQNQTSCGEERCGQNGPPIRFPFRLLKPGGPHPNDGCSYPGFNLYCVGTNTALEFQLNQNSSNPIFVAKIDYKSQEIRVHSSSNCLPKSLLSEFNNRSANPIFQFSYRSRSGSNYTLLKCPSKAEQCRTIMVRSEAEVELSRVELFLCSKIEEFRFVPDEIYRMISDGYDGSEVLLRWLKPDCRHCEAKGMRCRLKQINGVTSDEVECFSLKKAKSKLSPEITISMASSVFFLLVVGASIYFYTLNKNHKNQSQRIEKFLEDYAALKPSRYSFADIKKITNNFEDMVGQGTFGTVFKGKLSNDIFVAVKILNNSQGNGDDFINEVAAMNQIYHVNVVRLVGYCADGCRRALIYEFLSNDSLEKYISSSPSLSWEALYNIALGIAKGIEYLHQGCDKRILHFDIKPRNILLDHNFIPKISDFGLAKLCSKDQSAVSMKTARGTIGYIAPEVLSRNFGNVSYKSDVYSFGILLLEIVGRRKNTSANEEDVDEIYYPEWIYNLLEEGDDFRIFIEEEGNSEIIKKLAIVGLWCIQWHPINRPTMKFVIQMFEEESELTIPPNPFASLGSSRENTKNPSLRVPFELEAIAEEA